MQSRIHKIQDQFLNKFILLSIIESLLRVIISASFVDKVYILVLLDILITFIVIYFLSVKQILKRSYVVVIVLSFFFVSHYFYVMGSHRNVPIAFAWFLVMPIALRIFYSNRITLLFSVLVGVLVASLPFVAKYLGIINYHKERILNNYELVTAEFIIRFFLVIIALNCFYGLYSLIQVLGLQYPKFPKFGIHHIDEDVSVDEGGQDDEVLNGEGNAQVIRNMRDARLLGIYQSVLEYMDSSKAFLNPDYTLDQLSEDISVNKVALSTSLSQIGKVHFKDMINKYRVGVAKELFAGDEFRTNNIKQIYLSVGFKYHTTFNRVFKKLEGVTPSEYIIAIQNKSKE